MHVCKCYHFSHLRKIGKHNMKITCKKLGDLHCCKILSSSRTSKPFIRTSTRSKCVIHYKFSNYSSHAQFRTNTTAEDLELTSILATKCRLSFDQNLFWISENETCERSMIMEFGVSAPLFLQTERQWWFHLMAGIPRGIERSKMSVRFAKKRSQ